MLYTDALRGPHSTGVAAVDKDKVISVLKRAEHAFDFLQDRRADRIINGQVNVLLGHNRWATKGAINSRNAHPFKFDGIVGVHNGTLRGQWRLPDNKEFDVDSENIYHSIKEKGIDWTHENLEGAYALAWYDRETNQIQMVRNNERDLYYAFTKDKKTLCWASEYHMLTWLAGRNNIELEQGFQLAEHTLNSFEVPLGMAHQTVVFDKVRIRKLAPFVQPVYTGYNRYDAGAANGGSAANTNPFPRKHQNVIPIGQGTVATGGEAGKGDFGRLTLALSKPVVFGPMAVQRNLDGVSYWACMLDTEVKEDAQLDIRVHLNYMSTKDRTYDASSVALDTMFREGDLFEGTIRTINFEKGKPYGIIDRRTIVPFEDAQIIEGEDEDKPEELYLGYEGALLDAAGLAKATAAGCAWCASPFKMADYATLTWVESDVYICKDCMEQPDAQQYTQSH